MKLNKTEISSKLTKVADSEDLVLTSIFYTDIKIVVEFHFKDDIKNLSNAINKQVNEVLVCK